MYKIVCKEIKQSFFLTEIKIKPETILSEKATLLVKHRKTLICCL